MHTTRDLVDKIYDKNLIYDVYDGDVGDKSEADCDQGEDEHVPLLLCLFCLKQG